MTETTLIILAAGMGSRYGGLKQLDQFGPNGEMLMEYSLYDAWKSGFTNVVFVIRETMQEAFSSRFGGLVTDKLNVKYAYQSLEDLPKGFQPPAEREKPWGTAHALWSTREAVESPFVIANADDFYGRESFKLAHDYLSNVKKDDLEAALIGFPLKATLSQHGSVSRGICQVDAGHYLRQIVERTKIIQDESKGTIYYEEDGEQHALTGDELVSMNLMCFTPAVFQPLTEWLAEFLKISIHIPKSEFLTPEVLDNIRKNGAKIPVYKSNADWFGVTYKEDKPDVKRNIQRLIEEGVYPHDLWS